MVMTTSRELIARWRDHAETCRRYGAEPTALALEQAARELEETDAAECDVTLTLTEAARESGFSIAHLGRLVRQGSIPNAGRKRVPRIRRGDLPRRLRGVAAAARSAYDVDADARALVSRRRSRYGD
jgi:hypothetical protein